MKENKNFIPTLQTTEKYKLPDNLLNQIDLIAKNVHEEWARKRVAQGWQYGVERNEGTQLHPCLIPYDELSEEEKEYDRQTALITLKSTILLGFKFE